MVDVIAGVIDGTLRSQIKEAAEKAGVEVRFVRTSNDIYFQTSRNHPHVVLIHLDPPELSPVEAITAIRRPEEEVRDTKIVGFYSKVQEDIRQRAEDAGCSEVLSQSDFMTRLSDILKRKE